MNIDKPFSRVVPATAALAVALWASAAAAQGQPCIDDFTAAANGPTSVGGTSYRATAQVRSTNRAAAVAAVASFSKANGFEVLVSDAQLGLVVAAQSDSYKLGRTVPLVFVLKEEGKAMRLDMSFTTPAGMSSPEDAIKSQFCRTALAASAASSPATTAVGADADPARSAPGRRPATAGAAAPVHPPLAAPAPVGATPARKALPGFAAMNYAQQQAIETEFPKALTDERTRRLAISANSAITSMVERESCLANDNGSSAMNELAAPGVTLSGGASYFQYPMLNMQFHSKTTCLTVTKIHGWSVLADNALSFEVVYKAEDSGEVAKRTHTVVRQPDGAWQFRN